MEEMNEWKVNEDIRITQQLYIGREEELKPTNILCGACSLILKAFMKKRSVTGIR
jgi:hypothetical protein